MFDGRGPDKEHSDVHLLAEMIALLGPPPPKFLQRSKNSLEYWDEAGNLTPPFPSNYWADNKD